jgi:hypothetical protein
VDERTFLLASQGEYMPTALNRPTLFEAKGPLAQAGALAGKHHIVVGLNLTERSVLEMKDFARAILRERPDKNNNIEPFQSLLPLLEARSVLITADLGKEVRARAEIEFADPEQAAGCVNALEDGLALARLLFLARFRSDLNNEALSTLLDDGDLGPIVFGDTILFPGEKAVLVPRRDLKPIFVTEAILAQADKLLRKATVEKNDKSLHVLVQGKVNVAELLASARENALAFLKNHETDLKMATSSRNLLKLVSALQAYHEVNGKFPASGKLSWRVHILPYMDELAVYQEFKLDEAWDSAHNIKLLPKMPKVFATPGIKTKEPFTTPYQMFTGPGSFIERMKMGDEGLALAEAEATAWTRPGDLTYDAKKPALKLGGVFTDGFHVVFSTGRVQFVPINDGEDVVRILMAARPPRNEKENPGPGGPKGPGGGAPGTGPKAPDGAPGS